MRGTPAYHPLIRMLGGAPVVLPIPEVYTALEKGVIDGAASPVVGLLGVKWYEVAKYLAQPSFGFTHQLFLMNLATWNRLSDADKKVLLDEGRKIEEVWYREYDRMAEAEVKELIAKGVTVSKLGPDQAKLNEVWSEGLWELAEKKSPNEAKELRAIAKSKGPDGLTACRRVGRQGVYARLDGLWARAKCSALSARTEQRRAHAAPICASCPSTRGQNRARPIANGTDAAGDPRSRPGTGFAHPISGPSAAAGA